MATNEEQWILSRFMRSGENHLGRFLSRELEIPFATPVSNLFQNWLQDDFRRHRGSYSGIDGDIICVKELLYVRCWGGKIDQHQVKKNWTQNGALWYASDDRAEVRQVIADANTEDSSREKILEPFQSCSRDPNFRQFVDESLYPHTIVGL